jgi:hypothetical protein
MEIERLLRSVFALLEGHIGGALQELGLMIERATIGSSDIISGVVQNDHR